MTALVAGRQAGSSLDLCSESVDELPSEICPKRPYWVVAKEKPDLRYPASCDAYRCGICGPRKAEQSAAIMTWAIREARRRGLRTRLITGTQAPEEWQQRRQKVRDLRRWAVDELGVEFEMGWATERGGQTGMIHVHGIQHGSQKVPQKALQARWGAIVDIRQVRTPAAGVYAVKEALRVAGYVSKGATDVATLSDHLDLNGGRAAHWTRGFLFGLTKREALAQVRAEQADGEVYTWGLVPAWSR